MPDQDDVDAAQLLPRLLPHRRPSLPRRRRVSQETAPQRPPRRRVRPDLAAAHQRPPPHAFVRFARRYAAQRAAAGSGLLLRGPSAAVVAAPSFCFVGSRVEASNLISPHDFIAAWRFLESASSNFVINPSDETCYLVFNRDTALRCDVKLEFSVLNVEEALVFESTKLLLLRLTAAPMLSNRTVADDVYQSPVPTDLVDDDNDDPWVRTTDITGTDAIGQCWVQGLNQVVALAHGTEV